MGGSIILNSQRMIRLRWNSAGVYIMVAAIRLNPYHFRPCRRPAHRFSRFPQLHPAPRNPDAMRSHYCGQVIETLLDQDVTLCGWAHRRRDHGGVIFIDLRDREGLVQVVIDPDTPEAFAAAERVRNEYVLRIIGRVRRRPPGTENAHLPTGAVEVLAREVEILNRSEPLPFQLDDDDTSEEVRLRYRYLDLRRPETVSYTHLSVSSLLSRKPCTIWRAPKASSMLLVIASALPQASTTLICEVPCSTCSGIGE